MTQFLFQDNKYVSKKGWGLKPILAIYPIIMLLYIDTYWGKSIGIIIKQFGIGLVFLIGLWAVVNVLGVFLDPIMLEPKRAKYIHYIFELDPSFKFELLDGSEVCLNYQNIKKIETWNKAEYQIEDTITAKRYIFTRHLTGPDGLMIRKNEDGTVSFIFNEVATLLNKKIG